LHANIITSVPAIGSFPRLTKLSLETNRITFVAENAFAELPKLEYLFE
jgi:hypothetical protein